MSPSIIIPKGFFLQEAREADVSVPKTRSQACSCQWNEMLSQGSSFLLLCKCQSLDFFWSHSGIVFSYMRELMQISSFKFLNAIIWHPLLRNDSFKILPSKARDLVIQVPESQNRNQIVFHLKCTLVSISSECLEHALEKDFKFGPGSAKIRIC